jgi:hypothetical protein
MREGDLITCISSPSLPGGGVGERPFATRGSIYSFQIKKSVLPSDAVFFLLAFNLNHFSKFDVLFPTDEGEWHN